MAADPYAGQKGNSSAAVLNNQDNKCPADQTSYNPKAAAWLSQPGAAARANGFPRAS